ncbi:MAG: AIR synthase family protein [Anaerolineales bacterium]|jgi:hydrogenase expression/formation protein HypE
MGEYLPVGKLPVDLLRTLIGEVHITDSRVVQGPGVGIDCTVIDAGAKYLVVKTDPITFTAANIGWYAVTICANDIATTGAIPRWFLATILLPEARTTTKLVKHIQAQIIQSCTEIGATYLGGHTEITYGIERTILVGIMIGEVEKDRLISPLGAQSGDRLLLTKGIPIEATAVLAHEFSTRLLSGISEEELSQAGNFNLQPGISILKDAQIAIASGTVHAMHDPTEGGLATALWELAEACQLSVEVELDKIPIYKLSKKICKIFNIDPLGAIASGSLLIAVPRDDVMNVQQGLHTAEIAVTEIGGLSDCIFERHSKDPIVFYKKNGENFTFSRFERDEIGKLFS